VEFDDYGSYGNHLVFQEDGALVLYSSNMTKLWTTHTEKNHPGAYAFIGDTGRVMVLASNGTSISNVEC
jgi:hypothetical protein